jgi:hypothetical protein
VRKDVFNHLIEKFNNYDEISKNELKVFLLQFYPEMTESRFRWILHYLKDSGYITKLTDQNYKVNIHNIKEKYEINNRNIEVNRVLQNFNKERSLLFDSSESKDLDKLTISVWESGILNEFTSHQAIAQYIFVGVNKYRIEDLFFYLKENIHDWYITRDYKKEQYQLESESRVIVLLPLLNKSPIERDDLSINHYVTTPKIEKILVDIFHERKLFGYYDTHSLKEIFSNVNDKYNIDFTTLLYYARNRGKKNEMIEFISSIWGEGFI